MTNKMNFNFDFKIDVRYYNEWLSCYRIFPYKFVFIVIGLIIFLFTFKIWIWIVDIRLRV